MSPLGISKSRKRLKEHDPLIGLEAVLGTDLRLLWVVQGERQPARQHLSITSNPLSDMVWTFSRASERVVSLRLRAGQWLASER